MKRWLSGLLAALMLVSLASCGVPAGEQTARREEKIDLPTAELEEVAAPEEGEEGDPASFAADPDPGLPEEASLSAPEENREDLSPEEDPEPLLPEDGTYTSNDDVALDLHLYGRLPDNFITKKEAQDLGWPGGSLEPYAPGMCIGGSRFGNYEGLLPEAKGRTYTECDIDTLGAKSRGTTRIVFSNDGLIYYTEDHYESFELLYGDDADG